MAQNHILDLAKNLNGSLLKITAIIFQYRGVYTKNLWRSTALTIEYPTATGEENNFVLGIWEVILVATNPGLIKVKEILHS